MPSKQNLNRRTFIKTSGAAAGVLSTGAWSQLAAAESKAAGQKLNIACIGTAHRAAADILGVQGENIVAVCDVDSNYFSGEQFRRMPTLKKKFVAARKYADYREMLDKEGDKIDAVVVGTADHHHAPATIRAIRKGKHVYCEKPLTHTVGEARIIAEAAKKAGVATQMGTQIHA
jgi:predicted dehydrogenase